MLRRAANFSSNINFSNIEEAQGQLEKCDAFNLPSEGKLIIPQIPES